jgi:hypothetical protein
VFVALRTRFGSVTAVGPEDGGADRSDRSLYTVHWAAKIIMSEYPRITYQI